MVRGVPVGASSSASAKDIFPFRMLIRETEQTSPGVWKLTPPDGSAFFLRVDYLSCLSPDVLECSRYRAASAGESSIEFSDDQYADLLSASLSYSAEMLAMSYLARAEQCRAGLTAKLAKKGLDWQYIQTALDYLEGRGYLSDRRFAGAWLRSRAIDHAEGRLRLGAELAARGIGRDDAAAALDEFFSENDEGELCRKALARGMRTCRDREKLYRSLLRKGFTAAEIREAMQDVLPA